MKKNEVQGTEFVTTHDQLEARKPRRCRPDAKRVRATCCDNDPEIEIRLEDSVCEALNRASHYIQTLPQRIAEIEAATEAVLKEGRNAAK
jgi:hypothetical protein